MLEYIGVTMQKYSLKQLCNDNKIKNVSYPNAIKIAKSNKWGVIEKHKFLVTMEEWQKIINISKKGRNIYIGTYNSNCGSTYYHFDDNFGDDKREVMKLTRMECTESLHPGQKGAWKVEHDGKIIASGTVYHKDSGTIIKRTNLNKFYNRHWHKSN